MPESARETLRASAQVHTVQTEYEHTQDRFMLAQINIISSKYNLCAQWALGNEAEI